MLTNQYKSAIIFVEKGEKELELAKNAKREARAKILEIKRNKFCSICGKKYAHRASLSRHKKKCKKQKEKKDTKKEIERIERENKTFKALEIAVRERDEYYARACEYLKTIEELEEKIRKYES